MNPPFLKCPFVDANDGRKYNLIDLYSGHFQGNQERMAYLCKFKNKIFNLSYSGKASFRHTILSKRSVGTESTQGCTRVHLSADSECNDSDELRTVEKLISGNLLVYDNFISEEEEMMLYEEVRPSLEKTSYQHEHWDDVSTTVELEAPYLFIYLALPTRAGSPQQPMPITVGPFYLTHPVNFPCGRKPEYQGKTHDFWQSVDFYSFHMGLDSSRIEKVLTEA
jgi:hypothetical protein